ncbi:MAG TPA: hypothetical protein VFR27_05855 [Mycobacterium sp.]|nr:hypothetical protein [Mycobacterium sp.]
MVAIRRLSDDDLRELSQRTDPLGVVSVYQGTDPRQDPNLQQTAIEVKNRFRELQRRVAEDAGADPALAAALDRLPPRLAGLVSPENAARGRISFFALGSDWVLQLDSPMPVPTRLVLDDGPFIHPLLELLDEGRAAGVVLVSADEARLLEWRVGSLQLLSRMERQYLQAPHERSGQIGGGPEGQFHTPMREQRRAREDDRMQRFLTEAARVAGELAGGHGWERILISGGEHWTEATVAKFPPGLRNKLYADTRVLSGLDDAALATAVTEWAHNQHTEQAGQLLGRVRDAAGSGDGALGLSEVVAALNAGRVAHLVYDPNVRYTGTIGADGALYSGDEVGPNGLPGTPEPRLTERMVERALQTAARVSPVAGAATTELSDADGAAALLRW